MTDDLGAFIRARLDEDEHYNQPVDYQGVCEVPGLHLDYDRARRSVAAKRHLLATLRPGSPVLSILAYEWSDHPDYDREHWATETDLNPDDRQD